MSDQIFIESVHVPAFVGITPEERSEEQTLEISITMDWDISQAARTERLGMTIDYAEVHRRMFEVVQKKPRNLIETIAEDIAHMVLTEFHPNAVTVEIKKFVFKDARSVGVRINRKKK
jgi:7,8-dihydroneopterin aldolase/epimerase/oxygenase